MKMDRRSGLALLGPGATLLLLLPLLLFSVPPFALGLTQAQVEEVQTGDMEVERITIEGNRQVPQAEIKKVLPFKPGDIVTEEEIKAGGQKILDMGYFRQVLPDYRWIDGKIEVLYIVEENPVIEEIVIEGNEQYGEGIKLFGLKIPFTSPILKTERILELLKEQGIEEGKILNVKKLQAGLRAILGEYQKKGYTLVTIGDVEMGEVLKIRLIEGKIERIELKGIRSELEEIARSLIKIPLGQPVRVQAIQASFQRINGSIYFEKTGPADISFSPGGAPDRVILVWNLKERELLPEPAVIEEIIFTGATVYPSERLTRLLGPLPEGEMDNFQLLQALQGVYDLYHEDGYTMVGLANGGLEGGRLTIVINEGVINEVRIEGNTRTKGYVIRRRLRVRPGEILNEGSLRETYRNLQQLGYFQSIDIGFEEVSPGLIDLIISLRERENLGSFNGALSFAGGALVGKLSLSWKNIFGTGQDLSLGYDRTLLGQARANWHLDYTTLTFFPNYDYFKVSLYQKTEAGREEEDQEFTLNKGGIEASLGYPLGSETQLMLSQRYESSQKCYEEGGVPLCEPLGVTSSITLGLRNDDRNEFEFPTEGGIRGVSLEQAGAFTAGPRFTKLTFTLVQHFPSFKDQNLAFRFYGGTGFSLPSQEWFPFGGNATLRGITPFRTPKFFLVNAEYRAVLTEGAVGVLFFDLGLAEGAELQRSCSFGLELRVQLPGVGPVRLIFSWPVSEPEVSWQPRIDIAFGTMF